MIITFLGTGGAFCDLRVNYHNNALIETSAGPVLLDCGTTACQSIKELGRHPSDLHAVVITHLHGDHASPEQLVWERYYSGPTGDPGWKTTSIASPADVLAPLLVSLSPFLSPYVDSGGRAHPDGVDTLIDANATDSAVFGDLVVRWFQVDHIERNGLRKPAYGLWLAQGDVLVWWSGDTCFDAEKITAAARTPGCARLFHECTFTPRFQGTVHTHYEDLQTLPVDVRAKITLMHYTQVPDSVDVRRDGFAGAADRHETFRIEPAT